MACASRPVQLGDALSCVPGQLTVSRGAVIAGLVHGASDAFVYAQDAESKTAQRSYHALLPGDRAEVIAEGKGLVLAYPSFSCASTVRFNSGKGAFAS